jgi:hypothetical protein
MSKKVADFSKAAKFYNKGSEILSQVRTIIVKYLKEDSICAKYASIVQ